MAFRRGVGRSLAATAGRTALITGAAVATGSAVRGRAARREQHRGQPESPTPPALPAPPVTITADQLTDTVIGQLERLAALHRSGELTDIEFQTLKVQIVAGARS